MSWLEASISRWRLIALIVAALSLVASVAAWRTSESLERKALQESFNGQADLAAARIQTRMKAYEQVLRGGVALFAAYDTVKRDQWRDYVSALDLDKSYPGILGLGYAERVLPGERAAQVARIRAEGFPEYRMWPDGERSEYTAIVYLEPFSERNREAFGYDMMSEATRRAAMERARDMGEAALSGRVELVQEITPDKQAGFLLYLPVYTNGAQPTDIGARRAELTGYVYSPFRAADLMHGIMGDDFPQVQVQVYDGFEPDAAALLYDGWAGGDSAGSGAGPWLGVTKRIDVAGRQWTLVFRPTAGFVEENYQSSALVVLASGLVISLLLFVIVWGLMNTRQRALQLLRKAEQEREGSEAKFRDLFESAHDAFVLVDGEGMIADVNLQAERIFGYSRSELIGQKVEMLVPAKLSAAHVGLRKGYMEHPSPRMIASSEMAIVAQRKDGSQFQADISLTPIASGGETIVVAGVRDRTEQLAIESQLRQAQKMEAVGNLTGGMAHDFNNLLSVIIGNLDLFSERPGIDPSSKALADEALTAALRGATLIQRLLAFARRQPLQPQLCDINKLIRGIGSLIKRSLGENTAVELRLEEGLWPVMADPSQVEASLVNIANNAADAMPTGGRLIVTTSNFHADEEYASHQPGMSEGDYVRIEVSDTGEGMPQEVADKIFEPFFTTKEPGKGTGLGLSMVFGFVKQSGGFVTVYSEVGVGTTFRIYLPRAADMAEEAEAEAEVEPVRGGDETILVVEDKDSLRRLVVRQLEELGYKVLAAPDAASALNMLRAEKVDLLFSDVVMPGGMSGYELAHAAVDRWPAMKILLTSGFPDLRYYGDGEQGPVFPLLNKPYRKAELAAAVREALEG